MDLTIDRKILRDTVQLVLPALGDGKAVDAILSNIRLSAANSGVVVTASNGITAIHAMAEAKVLSPGIICLPGKALHEILSSLSQETVQLKIPHGKNQVQIRTDKAACHLSYASAEYYPPVLDYTQMEFRPVADDFFEKIKKVAFCAAKEEDQRFNLTGVAIDGTTIVATDAQKLGMVGTSDVIGRQCVIPANSIDKIKKALSYPGLEVCLTENLVHFKVNSVIASINLLAGVYPNYKTLIPKDKFDVAVANRESVLHALRFVGHFADGYNNQVRLEFKPGKLKLFSTSQSGNAEDIVDCQCDASMEIYLNCRFLAQALESMEGDAVSFELRGAITPIVIREEGYVQVIMPQRGSSQS